MFTGLVEATGNLTGRVQTPGGFRLAIRAPLVRELVPGDSVAVNGVCLTVVAQNGDVMSADIGPETARVTTLGALPVDCLVNLERPLRADGRFGGHFVQGHVDGIGRVVAMRADAEFHWLSVAFPSHLSPLFVSKGSVAVDGISLTVADLQDGQFSVMIVPYTLEHTNVSRMRPGDTVNLECDMVGKYVARAVQLYAR